MKQPTKFQKKEESFIFLSNNGKEVFTEVNLKSSLKTNSLNGLLLKNALTGW